MPRQMPSSGVPRPVARLIAVGPRAVERRGRAEVPDARDDDAVGAGELGGIGGSEELRARGRKSLANRREIARAVIDERNHRSPFVLGSIRAIRAIACARDAQPAGERLEYRLDLVMARAAVQHLHVDVGFRALGEPLEEVLDELCLQIADAADLEPQIDDCVHAAAQIDRRHGQRFVHRHHEVAGAVDAPAVAERRRDRLAERDPDVFDRVMLIDVEIPAARGASGRMRRDGRTSSSM